MDPAYVEKPTENSDSKESDLEQSCISTSEEEINGGGVILDEDHPWLDRAYYLKRCPSINDAFCFEIFEVRVSHSTKTSGKIHGTIYIDSSLGVYNLYKRNKNNAETISFPGTITLAGLPFALRADDPFIMHLDLWHGSDEVSKGFTTEISPFGWRVVDEDITDEVRGRNGAALVTYAVVSSPLVAFVEVILIKGNRKSGAKIYGTITASMTGWDVKRVLFCKKRAKYISVNRSEPIPLLRSLLIVARTSALHVDLDLADAFSFPNAPIASGVAKFSFDCDRAETTQTISGKFGEIEVKVNWWCYYSHQETYKIRNRYGV
ncbi:rRNA N-glycosidase [Rhynchospora pubera]|uniref:rRNA N-glycosidase n=1 Tax=Rhynchospora pubera TaxID=906938 RepID=A0AAV8HB02_9POAL|nr:rRNA N-glycosidase [Rhynchospora pubera]